VSVVTLEVQDRPETGLWAMLAGAVAGAVALGTGELVAGMLRHRTPSPVVAVADAVIDDSPSWFVRFGIGTFGTSDKPALVVGVLVLSALAAAVIGTFAVRRFAWGVVGFVAFGLFGLWASANQPLASTGRSAVTMVAATAAGIVSLRALLRRAPTAPMAGTVGHDDGRREFLIGLGACVAVASAFAIVGRRLAAAAVSTASRLALVLPRPARPAPPVPADASLAVAGITPLVTPNSRFYRIDTVLGTPVYDAEGWTLTVKGAVERPFTLPYAELLAMPMTEAYVTMACVSNDVGGPLVGTAKFLGVPLPDVLRRAGVRPGADQLVARSIDSFTAGMPVATVLDGRAALLAVGMNDEPLPHSHGFPLRLVVAGLYGYVSATKWLTELELTTFAAYDPYWVRLGWDAQAPVLVQSRVDVPRNGAHVAPGAVAVAGVAWAPIAGVRGVDVQVDDGPWQPARLAAALSDNTWRPWTVAWQATPGRHRLRVRATTTDGTVQTGDERDSFPNAATGWHTVRVTVR
jgi:DMSO/TMAO reductase YedYZ molybdopterin-dependent catalytic subunit